MVGPADELAYATVCDAEARKKFQGFLAWEFGEFAFDLGADDDRFAAEVLRGIVADGADVDSGGGVSGKVGEVVFTDVAGK